MPGNRMQLAGEHAGVYRTRVADRDIRLFMSERLKKHNAYHEAIDGAVRMLSGYPVIGEIVLLPDMTPAGSLPIGTAVTVAAEAPINPNLIGIDIGCGYTLFSVDRSASRVWKKGRANTARIERIVRAVDAAVTGHGKRGSVPDLSGLPIPKAEKAAGSHFGTLGGGNHFVDLFVIDTVYHAGAARAFGLDEEKLHFLVHTGSRTLGLETNRYFAELYGRHGPDFNRRYLSAVREVVGYASANRARIMTDIAEKLADDAAGSAGCRLILDAAHNDIEPGSGGGAGPGSYTIRKGCSRLRPGEAAVIPGTCTSHAYVVRGRPALASSLYSINHGVGRTKTRGQTMARYGRDRNLGGYFKGVVLNVEPKRMVEEVPAAYKDIEDIIDAVEQAGLAERVARLRPLGVVVERK